MAMGMIQIQTTSIRKSQRVIVGSPRVLRIRLGKILNLELELVLLCPLEKFGVRSLAKLVIQGICRNLP
jgi:hypothetical protein